MKVALLIALAPLIGAATFEGLPEGCFFAQGGIICDKEGYKTFESQKSKYKFHNGNPVLPEAEAPPGDCASYNHPQAGHISICNKGDEFGKHRDMFITTIEQGGEVQVCKGEWITDGLRLWCDRAGRIDIKIPKGESK